MIRNNFSLSQFLFSRFWNFCETLENTIHTYLLFSIPSENGNLINTTFPFHRHYMRIRLVCFFFVALIMYSNRRKFERCIYKNASPQNSLVGYYRIIYDERWRVYNTKVYIKALNHLIKTEYTVQCVLLTSQWRQNALHIQHTISLFTIRKANSIDKYRCIAHCTTCIWLHLAEKKSEQLCSERQLWHL